MRETRAKFQRLRFFLSDGGTGLPGREGARVVLHVSGRGGAGSHVRGACGSRGEAAAAVRRH